MRKLLTIIIFLATDLLVDAQVQPITLEYGQGSIANTAASVFRFDNIPVNLSTGIPDISIPLLSLPTRNKDIGVNMEMSYHPTSISSGGAIHDDIRQPGWSINRGGSIVKTSENVWFDYFREGASAPTRYFSDRYQFNFMGHSGIFYLITDANNNLVPSLYSGNGETLRVTLDYEPTNFRVNSFTIYDSKNYKYVFDVVDRSLGYLNPGSFSKNIPQSFNISAVYDGNGKKLLSFGYHELKTLERQTTTTKEYATVNKLISIQSEGFGKINFSSTFGASTVNSVSATIEEITLSDLNSNVIKRVDLRQWDRLTFRDVAQNKNEEYRFSYSDGTYGDYDTERGIMGIDPYGYPTFIRSEQSEDLQVLVDYAVNPKFCTKGVLEKILLPTGGTVLYEYESNTYSYFLGGSISEKLVEGVGIVEDPESYYTYYGGETTYPYNHIVEELYNGRIGNFSFFNISGAPKEVCIFIRENPYFSELSNTWVYPSITISGQELPQTDKQFPFYRTYNPENFGYGRSYMLNPGRYNIQLGHISESGIPMSATRVLHSIRRNPDLKKWKYGGGIRIKRVAHFDADVPADYFRKKDVMGYPNYVPVKETRYDYNLFNEPNRSSGDLISSNRLNFKEATGQLEFVSYRNVTVTDSGNNGKTQYTFSTAADFPELGLDSNSNMSMSQDFSRGQLLNRKEYDRNNVLIKSTDYTYGFYDGSRWQNYYMDRIVVDRTAKVRTTSETVTVYSTDSAPISQTTFYKFHRDANRSLESEETKNSTGEAIKSVYYYNTMGLPLNEQKFSLLEKSEDYYNGTLTATKWTKHTNTWAGNVSWLPSELSFSKAGGQEVVETKFNLYDEFGNLLQTEQPNGKKTSYIWGYNKTVMVAQIDNMAYASITPSLITDIQTATDTGTEATILQKLDLLRNNAALVDAMPTTYTYKPLIGISTVTDPKGDRISYEYDSFGRTTAIRDRNGKLVSDTSYKLTNQN